MHIDVETSIGFGGLEVPRRFHLRGRCVEVVDVIDQWHGADHRYVKVECGNDGLCILRFDKVRAAWELTLFKSARAQSMQSAIMRLGWSPRARPKRLS